MKKIIIILLTIYQINFAQEEWKIFGEMPNPVAGGAAINFNGYINIFGGESDNEQSHVNWVQKFHPFSSFWELDSTRFARYGLVVSEYQNTIKLFGGIFNETLPFNAIEDWIDSYDFEAAIKMNNIFNRIFSSGHVIGDNLYIIGGNPLPGTFDEQLPYIIEYNFSSDSITFKTDSLFLDQDLPEQQMTVAIGDDIFIFGGVINGISQSIYKFNSTSKLFEELTVKLITPRAGGKAIYDQRYNGIRIIGGYNEVNKALNSVELFTINGNEHIIEESTPVNFARSNFMIADFDGSIFIFGGEDENENIINSIESLYFDAITGNEMQDQTHIPNKFKLYQNYPNPFNPTTTIKYNIPSNRSGKNPNVKIIVYDILGNEVMELVNKSHSSGEFEIILDAKILPSGIYFYQLTAESLSMKKSFLQTKKMILLK